MDLHVAFLLAGLILLIVEVYLGMTLGIALSGAITFFILGLLAWMNLISSLNNILIVGVIIFLTSTFFVLKYFKNQVRQSDSDQDVNDY
jgi:membrane protein implicated in regulation of membrane protease activity